MKKVLIVETNIQYYPRTNTPTGLWLGETAEFVDEMEQKKIKVGYVSPKGGYVPIDPRSMKYVDDSIMRIYKDEDFIERALSNTMKPKDVNPSEYIAIYYTGGHGVMWDFPDNEALQKIALSIYQNQGYLLSVCHGIAGLFNIKNEKDQYVIAHKKITGFSTTEEIIARKKSDVPFLNEKMAKDRNAIFVKKRFYKNHVIQDGRIITGQNPFSVRSVAKTFYRSVENANDIGK